MYAQESETIIDRMAHLKALLGKDSEMLPKGGISQLIEEDFQSPSYVEPVKVAPPMPPLYDRSIITLDTGSEKFHIVTRTDPATERETEAILVQDPHFFRDTLGNIAGIHTYSGAFLTVLPVRK